MSARILVVDDNEMNLDVLTRRLTRQGYEVLQATGGREALDVIESQNVDLALFDVMMPEVSGLDALAIVRETHTLADLPIIMVTARSQREDVVAALELGANDYVTKPVDFPVLLARVRTHLELRRLSQLKDEFLAIASHDLKNPLTDVLGVAGLVEELVRPGTPMPEPLHALVSNMKKSAKRMQAIIEDFLDFNALDNGQLELSRKPVDLLEVTRDVTQANRTYAESKRITLDVELPENLPLVPADRARVAQVVQNLVDNALKYGKANGTTLVRVTVEQDGVRVEVADCGPGIPDGKLESVFEKYARVGNLPTGGERSSGLGLHICKQIVELHGGQVGVHNNPGGGATFWFTLPFEPARVSAPQPS